jgi:integrase
VKRRTRRRGAVVERNGLFHGVASYVDPATGKRKRWWGPGRPGVREAERDLTEFHRQLDTDAVVRPAKEKVGHYLTQWIDGRHKLREPTRDSYRRLLVAHVIPRLGSLRLSAITADHLNRLYGDLLREGRKDGKGGLSSRTVRYIHVVLHKAFEDAVKYGKLSRNPAQIAEPPPITRPEMRTWRPEEVSTFLTHVADDRLYPAWLLAVGLGMRKGEILGLRWYDVDLEAATLAVRHALTAVRYELVFGEPKTSRSRRSLPLTAAMVAALRAHRSRQSEERLAWGLAWANPRGLVFTRENGDPVHPDAFQDIFERHMRKAGVPRIRFHDTRHTFATLALQAGIHPKVVSEILGHATIAITLDTYSHVIPAMQKDVERHSR